MWLDGEIWVAATAAATDADAGASTGPDPCCWYGGVEAKVDSWGDMVRSGFGLP